MPGFTPDFTTRDAFKVGSVVKDGEAGEDEVGRAEKELDKSTHTYTTQIDELVKHKEGELLEV